MSADPEKISHESKDGQSASPSSSRSSQSQHGKIAPVTAENEVKLEKDGLTDGSDGTPVVKTKSQEKRDKREAKKAVKSRAGEPDPEDGVIYPKGFSLVMITAGLCLTTFLIALDNTIIATAIPTITTQFNSLEDVGWYGSVYLLTQTSLQPSSGKLYRFFSLKYCYILAVFVFEVGSLICALAINSPMLIVGRAIAGSGSAALYSGGMVLIRYTVPLRQRALFIAGLSSMFGIASIVGPILGGVFTDKIGWRWCFWINLPVGGITAAMIFVFFQNPHRPEQDLPLRKKFQGLDIDGALILISAVVCMLLALQWGGTTYPWRSWRIILCLVLSGLLVIAFILMQLRKGDEATLPPRVVGQRTVLASAIFSVCFGMALFTHIYFLPFYFQAVKGTTAEGSGIRSIPYLLANTLFALVVGGTITAVGWYVPFMWVSAPLFAVGCGLLYSLRVNSSAGQWIGYQILAGAGAGAGVQIPFIAVQVVLADKDLATGNAIVIFFQSLGGAIAISIAQSIFSNALRTKIPLFTTGVDTEKVIFAGATHLREVVTAAQLPGVLRAYSVALNQAFILPIVMAGIALFASFFMEMKSIKGKNLSAGLA